jgi:hypothetical protein
MRQIDGCCDYWLCIAYELNLDAYLMIMHLSHYRTIFVCYQFVKQLGLSMAEEKAVFAHGAHW